MKFEFDTSKSDANRAKHGIDFVEAQSVWNDQDRITGPADSQDEIRWQTIGLAGNRLVSVFWTERNGAIRIISVRAAREEEREVYEQAKI
jgi:uncharacterized DUF497 family protein